MEAGFCKAILHSGEEKCLEFAAMDAELRDLRWACYS